MKNFCVVSVNADIREKQQFNSKHTVLLCGESFSSNITLQIPRVTVDRDQIIPLVLAMMSCHWRSDEEV